LPSARRLAILALACGALAFVAGAPLVSRAQALATVVDGPAPRDAEGVIVFLHGLGRGTEQGGVFAKRLRAAGLSPGISVVIVRAPYRFGLFGFSWGDDAEERAQSRARLRATLASLHARKAVVLSGFSQGAGMALDTAAEEPLVCGVASMSPCASDNRGLLPDRNLRFLLAHGALDSVCPVEESRSLAKVLAVAGKSVSYVEFDGRHEMPREVIEAIAAFAAR